MPEELVARVFSVDSVTKMTKDPNNPREDAPKIPKVVREILLADGRKLGCWDGQIAVEAGHTYAFLVERRANKLRPNIVYTNVIAARMAQSVDAAPMPAGTPLPSREHVGQSYTVDEPLPPLYEDHVDHPVDRIAAANAMLAVAGLPPHDPGKLVSLTCPHCRKNGMFQIGPYTAS